MKILLIPGWYETPDNKNSGVFFKEQFELLKKYDQSNSYELLAVNVLYFFQYRMTLLNKKKSKDETVVNKYVLNRLSFKKRSKIHSNIISKLLLNYKNVDVIICMSGLFNIDAIIDFCKCKSIKLILIEHSSLVYDPQIPDLIKNYAKVKLKFAVSKSLANKLKSEKLGNFELIHNPVDIPDVFINSIKAKYYDLMHVSNFSENKRSLEILKIIKMYNEKFKCELKVVFVGSGPTLKDCKNYARSNKLNVYFTGILNKYEVYKLYSLSRIYFHYSNVETFGLSIAEAYKIGCEIISNNNGGINEYLSESQYYLIESKSDGVNAINYIKLGYKKNISKHKILETKDFIDSIKCLY